MKKKILIFTEASKKIGYGHLSRCIFLSQKLKKNKDITFVSKFNIEKYLPKTFKFLKFKNLKKINNFDGLIIDLKYINKDYFKFIKNLNIENKVVISEKEYKDLNPKLTIIPYEINPKFSTKKNIIFGKKALIFSHKLIEISKKKKSFKQTKNFQISICLGGSDPKNYTAKIIRNLIALKFSNIFFNVIIGSFYEKKNEIKLRNVTKHDKNFKILRNPKNIYTIFKNSDFAIVNSGNVKYEFAALGIPFFLFANDKKAKLFCKFFKRQFKFFYDKNFNFPKKVYLYSLLNYISKKNKTLVNFANFNKRKLNLNSIDNVINCINNTIN